MSATDADLSTYAGQRAHYAAVRARLAGTGRPVTPRRQLTVTTRPVGAPRPPGRPAWPPYTPPVPYDDCFGAQSAIRTASQIIAEVARDRGVSVGDIVGENRTRAVSLARHEAAYRIREELHFSWGRIGRALGDIDHTTALNGWRRHKERMGQG